MEIENEIKVYTDGSCTPNPGRGGWALIIKTPNGEEIVVKGAECSTTNNRMELMGVVCALEFLAEKASLTNPLRVVLHSDSNYVVNTIHRQKVKTWSQQTKRLNAELWLRLSRAMAGIKLSAKWVAGDAVNPEIERCHKLAEEARLSCAAPVRILLHVEKKRDVVPERIFQRRSKVRKEWNPQKQPMSLILKERVLSQTEIHAKRALARAARDERLKAKPFIGVQAA